MRDDAAFRGEESGGRVFCGEVVPECPAKLGFDDNLRE
jgi:hypothetical protein